MVPTVPIKAIHFFPKGPKGFAAELWSEKWVKIAVVNKIAVLRACR